jgi:hypothetical protein
MEKKETYLNVIDGLLKSVNSDDSHTTLSKVYYGILTLIENLYGKNDIRITNLSKFKVEKYDTNPFSQMISTSFKGSLKGALESIKSDIENDLIFNLEKQTIGSVVADFITLAKTSIESGNKDVAAVLASAALEDSLKRYAILNNLQADDKDMSEVISALKSKGLLKGPQASVITSYTKTRNKAFHAEFEAIEMPEVKSLITFTEEFILKNLS